MNADETKREGRDMGEPTMRLLSLGAGRQSTTLLMLSADGTLPKLDGAIFSDDVYWLPVKDWPYRVSHDGQVKRATDACGTRAGRLLKPRLYKHGYLYVCLHDRERSKHRQVHVLVAEAFLDRSPGEPVNHRNGVKTDNFVLNLEVTTAAGNAAHAAEHGLVQQGERHYATRLSNDDVRAIRTAATDGVPRKVIAARYGLSKSGLGHIIRGKNWRTVA